MDVLGELQTNHCGGKESSVGCATSYATKDGGKEETAGKWKEIGASEFMLSVLWHGVMLEVNREVERKANWG